MPLTQEEVLARISQVLVEALAADPAAIVPEARIMDDLNAESIDLLDMRFRLERAFGIKITADDLAAAFRGASTASEFRALFTVGSLCQYIVHRLETKGD